MVVTELIDRFKRPLRAIHMLVVVVVVGPVRLYSVTPSRYYVADDGLITVSIKAREEPVVVHCPDFHEGLEDISLRGHYVSSYNTTCCMGLARWVPLPSTSTASTVARRGP